MNKCFIVGNLTRDPELRSTRDGISVCSFTVAVNRRNRGAQAGQQEADYFRVTAWRQLGENCARYLAKGRKVSVVGPVTVSTYTGNDGATRANLEMTADDVEFLTPKGEGEPAGQYPPGTVGAYDQAQRTAGGGYVQVDDDDLPF